MNKVSCFMLVLMLLFLGSPLKTSAEEYTYGAWLPYWDADASMAEAESLADGLDSAVAFECLFDSNNRLLMLDDTKGLLSSLQQMFRQTNTKVYLSIVNDIEVSEGKYENKSADLLQSLFKNEEAMSGHLDALAALIDEYSLDGLELDYENIKKDAGLWANYVAFIGKVWEMCERNGVRLRIVLPWDAPKYVSLPNGPEYSVMCYNLYGYHSGAGPKADFDFLNTICKLYLNVQGKVRMAFATGGFDWSNGKVTALTQEQAEDALLKASVTPTRDADSGVMNAIYEVDGIAHEIWYADAATLAAWRNACAVYGYTAFDLFRLGGNDLNDWGTACFAVRPK